MPTVKELKTLCKENGIKRYSNLNKDELIKLCYDNLIITPLHILNGSVLI